MKSKEKPICFASGQVHHSGGYAENCCGDCPHLRDCIELKKPDLYGHTKDGEPITIPPEYADEWEIVPEGEKLPEGGCPFFCGVWCAFPDGLPCGAQGEDGYAHLAGSDNRIRAYARRKVKREEVKDDDAEALRIGRAVLKDAERTELFVGDLCEFSDNEKRWYVGFLLGKKEGSMPFVDTEGAQWKHCRRITALELVRRAKEGGEG